MTSPLYLPADVALWLLLESGVEEESPDVAYLRSLGQELVLIQEGAPSAESMVVSE